MSSFSSSSRRSLLCSYRGTAVEALCFCGDAQGMCFDWFAPDGSRRIHVETVSQGALTGTAMLKSWTEREGASSSDFREHSVDPSSCTHEFSVHPSSRTHQFSVHPFVSYASVF